jgi:hypothetical protein
MLQRGFATGRRRKTADDLLADDALAVLVRQLVSDARLPDFAASQIIARYGDDSSCAACGKNVRNDDVMYELRFGIGRAGDLLKMHLRCFLAWERAITR